MWKNYFKGILNSGKSANESAEFVEHSTDCKETYLLSQFTISYVHCSRFWTQFLLKHKNMQKQECEYD